MRGLKLLVVVFIGVFITKTCRAEEDHDADHADDGDGVDHDTVDDVDYADEEDCKPTSADDVMVAALHSDYVYGDHGEINVGDSVIGAPNYVVEKVWIILLSCSLKRSG